MVNGKKYRVDSYNPGKEIVSRKFSQLSQGLCPVKFANSIGTPKILSSFTCG